MYIHVYINRYKGTPEWSIFMALCLCFAGGLMVFGARRLAV